jgi:hypothetical protein
MRDAGPLFPLVALRSANPPGRLRIQNAVSGFKRSPKPNTHYRFANQRSIQLSYERATTNSGTSVTLAVMELAMKQCASTLSIASRAGASSASLLNVTAAALSLR